MRYVVWGWLALSAMSPARAQTFAEWFKQNSTRLKYYSEQIAALQVYSGEVEKEYSISDAGLSSISENKQGEFDLHQGYYASLGEINPAVRESDEVTEITALQTAIIQRFTDALTRYRADGVLSADRLAYIAEVYSTVLQAGLADEETLSEVLKAGNWQMTDDQRLGRIRHLEAAMKDRYAFTLAFIDRADLLERQQVTEGADIGTAMGLYGVR
jgi:hypothetical protein